MLHEEVLLSSEKNETSVEVSCNFCLLSERKTFIEEWHYFENRIEVLQSRFEVLQSRVEVLQSRFEVLQSRVGVIVN